MKINTNLKAGATADNLSTVDCSYSPCKNWYGVPVSKGVYRAYNCYSQNSKCWDMNGKNMYGNWIVDPLYNMEPYQPVYAQY